MAGENTQPMRSMKSISFWKKCVLFLAEGLKGREERRKKGTGKVQEKSLELRMTNQMA